MDTILDTTKLFCLLLVLVYFQQMLHATIVFLLLVLGNYIGISFWQDGAGHRHNGSNLITRNEEIKTILSHATSVGNKRKQTEDRNVFCHIQYCVHCDISIKENISK